MGIIERLFHIVFGGGRNVVKDTVEVFRENAEAGAGRAAEHKAEVVAQYGAEFAAPARGGFDRFMDGLNRVPRPAMALGTLGLFIAAMVEPVWFAERMQGIALVPEPLWWLLGAIVSFYFGARHQAKGQEFQASLARSMARLPAMADDLARLRRAGAETPGVARSEGDADLTLGALRPDANPALEAWKHGGGRR